MEMEIVENEPTYQSVATFREPPQELTLKITPDMIFKREVHDDHIAKLVNHDIYARGIEIQQQKKMAELASLVYGDPEDHQVEMTNDQLRAKKIKDRMLRNQKNKK